MQVAQGTWSYTFQLSFFTLLLHIFARKILRATLPAQILSSKCAWTNFLTHTVLVGEQISLSKCAQSTLLTQIFSPTTSLLLRKFDRANLLNQIFIVKLTQTNLLLQIITGESWLFRSSVPRLRRATHHSLAQSLTVSTVLPRKSKEKANSTIRFENWSCSLADSGATRPLVRVRWTSLKPNRM